jgi:hypothetical protein
MKTVPSAVFENLEQTVGCLRGQPFRFFDKKNPAAAVVGRERRFMLQRPDLVDLQTRPVGSQLDKIRMSPLRDQPAGRAGAARFVPPGAAQQRGRQRTGHKHLANAGRPGEQQRMRHPSGGEHIAEHRQLIAVAGDIIPAHNHINRTNPPACRGWRPAVP